MNGSLEHSSIMIVDDDVAVVHTLETMLQRAGLVNVHSTTDSRRALPLLREVRPDLVLLDLHMPHLDGYAVMAQILSRMPRGEYFPILVVSGDLDRPAKQRALSEGAKDFITKPFDAPEATARVKNLLETRRLYTHMRGMVRRRTRRLRQAELEIAERLAAVAELKDYGDSEHTTRVGRLAAGIGHAMRLPRDQVALLRRAAPLHDLGKIAIPDSILLRAGPLTLDEMDLVKSHTSVGARMLSGSRSRLLQTAEEIALYHHENWDGTGYTPGLAGESIPLPGRIAAVADVWDALTHNRPYKSAWTGEEALSWIRSQAGQKFDPAVVEALILALGGLMPVPEARE